MQILTLNLVIEDSVDLNANVVFRDSHLIGYLQSHHLRKKTLLKQNTRFGT